MMDNRRVGMPSRTIGDDLRLSGLRAAELAELLNDAARNDLALDDTFRQQALMTIAANGDVDGAALDAVARVAVDGARDARSFAPGDRLPGWVGGTRHHRYAETSRVRCLKAPPPTQAGSAWSKYRSTVSATRLSASGRVAASYHSSNVCSPPPSPR